MRCLACNTELNDFEATRKDSNDQFIDMCNSCFKAADYEFDTNDRFDLLNEADITYPDEIFSSYNDDLGY